MRLVFLALLIGLSLCSSTWTLPKSISLLEARETNLYQALGAVPELSKFLDMVDKNANASTIKGILTGANKLFLLAPSNTALDDMPALSLDDILYHIVKAGAITVPTDGECMETELRFSAPVLNSVVCFDLANQSNPSSPMLVNGVDFAASTLASNGQLFVLSKVLTTPPPLVNATTDAGAGIGAQIFANGVGVWGGQALTFLAPTDGALKAVLPAAWAGFMQQEAGAKLAQKWVGYNSALLPLYEGDAPFNNGGGVLDLLVGGESANVTGSLVDGFRINGIHVLEMDLLAKDGVAHLLDGVLSSPVAVADFSLEQVMTGLGLTQTLGYLKTADLLTTLANTSRSFTIFAPTDAAWGHVGKPPKTSPASKHVMQLHILPELVPAPVVKKGMSYVTLDSKFKLYFKSEATVGVVGLNDGYDRAGIAALYGPGAPAQPGVNGYVYVIDQVLTLPDSNSSKKKPHGLEVKWIVLIVICGVVVLLVAVAAVGGAAYWFYKNRYLPRQGSGYAEVLDDNEAYSETFE